jgi:hypothetical protein
MAAAFVMAMVTANVRRHESLHPATEVAVFMRPQQQVEMACHQTKSSQPHRLFFVSLPHQVHKRDEVIIFVKDVAAAIARVQDTPSVLLNFALINLKSGVLNLD